MKKLAMVALGLTSACISGGSGSDAPATLPDSNFTADDIIDRAVGGQGVTLRFGEVSETSGTVTIGSVGMATMRVGGHETTLFSSPSDTFEDGLGNAGIVGTRLAEGPFTPDVLYVFTVDAPAPSFGAKRVGMFVDGNVTAISNLPTGSVTYTGTTFTINDAERPLRGSISIEADFADSSFDATLRAVNLENPFAVYTVVDGTENGGRLSGAITGADATDGGLNGRIFGRDGGQAAGTFSITTDDTALIGTFGATD